MGSGLGDFCSSQYLHVVVLDEIGSSITILTATPNTQVKALGIAAWGLRKAEKHRDANCEGGFRRSNGSTHFTHRTQGSFFVGNDPIACESSPHLIGQTPMAFLSEL